MKKIFFLFFFFLFVHDPKTLPCELLLTQKGAKPRFSAPGAAMSLETSGLSTKKQIQPQFIDLTGSFSLECQTEMNY